MLLVPKDCGPLQKPHVQEIGQEEESSYHVLSECPVLTRHKTGIFGSLWLEPVDARRTSS
jgi:hypothetical protein